MNNLPSVRKAQRAQSKASIVIEGLAGHGKSGIALMIAHALAKDWNKVFCVDTEQKSLDLFDSTRLSDGVECKGFNKVDLTDDFGYAPSTYLALRKQAIEMGCTAFVQDSITHSWIGQGGVLDIVNEIERSTTNKANNFTAWGDPVASSEKNNIIKMYRDPDIHVISTVRVKEKFEMITGEGVHSLGEQQIMQADSKYEPDLLLHAVEPGTPDGKPPVVKVLKSRYAPFRLNQTIELTADLLAQLVAYLDEGISIDEVRAMQRDTLITAITDILKTAPVKQTAYKMFKKSNKLSEDTKLAELTLDQLENLYNTISKH